MTRPSHLWNVGRKTKGPARLYHGPEPLGKTPT
jgi:hypothetical protein